MILTQVNISCKPKGLCLKGERTAYFTWYIVTPSGSAKFQKESKENGTSVRTHVEIVFAQGLQG